MLNDPGLLGKRIAITAVLVLLMASLPASPVAIAAQPTAVPATTKTKTKIPTNDEQLAQTLDRIERTLQQIQRKTKYKQSVVKDKKALKGLHQALNALDKKAMLDFSAIEKRLKKGKLPAVIMQRHKKAVAHYSTTMATLKTNLNRLAHAKDKAAYSQALDKATAHLTEAKKKEKRKPNDPKHNPHRALQPKKNNNPKTNKKAFRTAGLFDTPYPTLAAHGDFDISKLPGADDPAFLSETPEVRLSEAIKAKAAELEHNPIKIFNWVHDNTEWLPTFGAIQNSDHALLTQKGNAFDLASLLIALYRASGMPARYAHGTIDIPADKFMNWMGGFTSPEGAHDLAANSGLPITSVTDGGKIVAFRLEHVWVEVALDFTPSRGAINKAADSWVQLDPSFKQYEAEPAYDMHALLNFDGDQHFQDYFNDPADLTPYQFYSKRVLDYLNTNMPEWTLKGLYGHERIRPVKTVTNGNLRSLAASLPYMTKVKGYSAHAIPDGLRHKVAVGIANDPSRGIDAQYSIALSELGYDRLTLSYIPESSADDAVVEDYGSLYSAPAYLVRVKPQLRLDGQVVATGLGIDLGTKHTLLLEFKAPTLNGYPVNNEVSAGAYSAVVVQGLDSAISIPGQSMGKFRDYIQLNRDGEKANDDNLGQYLSSLGKLWFYDAGFERNFYAKTSHTPYIQLPSQAIVTADLTVSFFLGIPKTVTGELFTIDIDTDVMAMGTIDNKVDRKKDFMILAGMTGSSWEGLEIENLFGGQGVSAVEVIQTAKQRGAPVHFIDSANIAEKLPLLSLSSDDITDIKNYVNRGFDVIAPETEITIGRWRGAGLINLDPDTKTGPYLLSGGLAGGGSLCGTDQDPNKLCTIDKWDEKVYDYPFFTSAIRNAIIGHAKTWDGSPYGLGCKDSNANLPNTFCAEEIGISDDFAWIDCSGLVASAYYRVGFPFFRGSGCLKDKAECTVYYNAQGQWDLISTLPFGSHPNLGNVKVGDLIFWYGGWTSRPTKSKPIPEPRVDHVGIITYVGSTLGETRWIAAEGSPWSIVLEFDFSDVPSERLEPPRFHGFGSIIDD